jgi:hypothetical protein
MAHSLRARLLRAPVLHATHHPTRSLQPGRRQIVSPGIVGAATLLNKNEPLKIDPQLMEESPP